MDREKPNQYLQAANTTAVPLKNHWYIQYITLGPAILKDKVPGRVGSRVTLSNAVLEQWRGKLSHSSNNRHILDHNNRKA